ncbi:MAG: hypothetical protein IKM18_01030 [Clostridia bacterium]|nr:hypothetical protein [Clostridia bacterium]MBR3714470.1 hypothetical protein [Clostridia bacterium]
MKKIYAIILAAVMLVSLSACGNYDAFDTVYTYDYAIVSFPDGTTQTIELEQWTDYEGEQIQITAKDGTVYLVNSVNCVLVKKSDK